MNVLVKFQVSINWFGNEINDFVHNVLQSTLNLANYILLLLTRVMQITRGHKLHSYYLNILCYWIINIFLI